MRDKFRQDLRKKKACAIPMLLTAGVSMVFSASRLHSGTQSPALPAHPLHSASHKEVNDSDETEPEETNNESEHYESYPKKSSLLQPLTNKSLSSALLLSLSHSLSNSFSTLSTALSLAIFHTFSLSSISSLPPLSDL